jgi:hypothetical protein
MAFSSLIALEAVMKLGKALSTGYAQDAYEHETDNQELPASEERDQRRTPDPVKVTVEAAQPRQVVDAAAR